MLAVRGDNVLSGQSQVPPFSPFVGFSLYVEAVRIEGSVGQRYFFFRISHYPPGAVWPVFGSLAVFAHNSNFFRHPDL